MTYLISIDPDTKEYIARFANLSKPVGRGESLFAAIDDLERKLVSKEQGIMIDNAVTTVPAEYVKPKQEDIVLAKAI